MIEIAEKLKKKHIKFKMLLVGHGDLKNDINEQIIQKKLQTEVILLGVREDIPTLLKVFDVFLMYNDKTKIIGKWYSPPPQNTKFDLFSDKLPETGICRHPVEQNASKKRNP